MRKETTGCAFREDLGGVQRVMNLLSVNPNMREFYLAVLGARWEPKAHLHLPAIKI